MIAWYCAVFCLYTFHVACGGITKLGPKIMVLFFACRGITKWWEGLWGPKIMVLCYFFACRGVTKWGRGSGDRKIMLLFFACTGITKWWEGLWGPEIMVLFVCQPNDPAPECGSGPKIVELVNFFC